MPPREVELGTERMTIGRHPHNDIVLDHATVSSRHAAITLIGDQALLEDLGSTNGTYVGGKRVQRHKLDDRAHAVLAGCHLDFVAGLTGPPPTIRQPGTAPATAPLAPSAPQPPASSAAASSAPAAASIVVRSGVNTGRQLPLTKPLTTLGSPGVLVVVIARQGSLYTLTHVEGGTRPFVNGAPLGKEPMPLSDGDVIDLAGTTMSFLVAS